jgi:hypothetical protein
MTFVKQAQETLKQNLPDGALAIPCQAFQTAAGQKETAVPLRRLPPGVTFGDNVGEPIYYDSVRKMLIYRGFMCQASYNYLHRLAITDPEYETAIDQLYLGSAVEGLGHSWRWLIGTVIAVAAAAGGIWLWMH